MLTARKCDCGLTLHFGEKEEGMDFSRRIARCGCGIVYHDINDGQLLCKSKPGKDEFICVQCGSVIKTETVAHPIHDGPFAFSGSGSVEYGIKPYCPKCQEQPSFHGLPIRPPAGEGMYD